MTIATPAPSRTRRLSVPNVLTYGRMAAVPVVIGCMYWTDFLGGGLRVSVPVTRLAKWKTTVQLVAIGFLIAGKAGDRIVPITTAIGLSLLWISALVTLYTGWDYLRAGIRHMLEE